MAIRAHSTRRSILKSIPSVGLAALVPVALVGVVHDPMLNAIEAYRRGVAEFAAIPKGTITLENEEELTHVTFGHAQDLIMDNVNTPKVTSLHGVREAIRLAFEIDAIDDCLAQNALSAALDYLDQTT